jgi:hypothetical protein
MTHCTGENTLLVIVYHFLNKSINTVSNVYCRCDHLALEIR